ncbi:MAG: sensor histidine kinase, partial [Marinobacter sp.]|nr:sensor histidine kinase [Marinobacter sp.]
MIRFPLKTLYARLALGLFLLLVTVGISYAFLSGYTLREYQASLNQELNRDLARNLVADRNLVDEGRLNEAALQELFSLYMTINPSIEIYLLDRAGQILAYSADPARIKRKRVSLEPIRALLANQEEYPVLGDDPRSHDRRKVFSVTP